MDKIIANVLSGKVENHVLPFFWQHGEDEATLRKMMRVINDAGCQAVCVESRPHPDFCGEKWWKDMDVILEEARNRNMKVWILDDSHFPTGYANGALKDKPDTYCRQNIFMREKVLSGKDGVYKIDLKRSGLLKPEKPKLNPFEKMSELKSEKRKFSDDSILSVTVRQGEKTIDLTGQVKENRLMWEKPEGEWTLSVIVRSRNTGAHRDYINMTEEASCRILLDAVYEPHWKHYADDFGNTIAGFFSDEPELGNGRQYQKGNVLGTNQDLPWGETMEKEVAEKLGEGWKNELVYLWCDGKRAERTRSLYMDVLTKRVRTAFSKQISEWCHAHGVEYIGHVIEDDGQHCRTGSSLGHYFRGLQYQDMSGIDDIGGQVYPQGEDEPTINFMHQPRNGEFYHYALAKLAQSAAAIEHRKKGRAMCEIFGNYGWSEGVQLEKYLADHFLVRGINYFVPHAFTGKEFPDPDCPPHFYAQGHNPQYRHFGELIRYMNRVATVTSSGRHKVPIAILYHGEAEWADSSAMPFEKPLRILYDHQIDCHVIPADVFSEPEYYRVTMGSPFKVNEQRYEALVIPDCKCLTQTAVQAIERLLEAGLPVYFIESKPERIAETGAVLPEQVQAVPCVPLDELYKEISSLNFACPILRPENNRIRLLHIEGECEKLFVVNEAKSLYQGTITIPTRQEECCVYEPWSNRCYHIDSIRTAKGLEVSLCIEPLKPVFVVCGCAIHEEEGLDFSGEEVLSNWTRSICAAIDYPNFGQKKEVILPDHLEEEQPKFSGVVRYETVVEGEAREKILLEISDASEGVEVFVNGESLGIQIAPPYRYNLTAKMKVGKNNVAVEVATTLERQVYPLLIGWNKLLYGKPASASGINGTVKLIRRK